MPKEIFKRAVLALLFLTLFFGGLYFAGGFLKPLSVALLLAFVLLPVGRWLENKGLDRLWSSLICVMIFIAVLAGIGGLVAYQGQQFGEQYTELKEQASESFDEVTKKAADRLGLSKDELVEKMRTNSLSSIKSVLQRTIMGISSSMADLMLIIVYIFAFLYYRRHFKKFFIKLFHEERREKITGILQESIDAALLYLRGKVILIGILAVCYSIGLTLIGIQFGVFYGILAALLSIIPYIGNIIGGGLPLFTALLSGNTTGALMVIGLFTVIQFIESYILTPQIVGKKVDLHPLITILSVVLGGSLWGVVGMIIAIPYLGITMVILQYIPKMEPYAFLLKENED